MKRVLTLMVFAFAAFGLIIVGGARFITEHIKSHKETIFDCKDNKIWNYTIDVIYFNGDVEEVEYTKTLCSKFSNPHVYLSNSGCVEISWGIYAENIRCNVRKMVIKYGE